MSFIVVGTNHKYSPITLRERLSFSKKRLRDSLFLLEEREFLKGAVILSTCNRVEVYASTEDSESGIREIEDFISRYHEIDKQRFSPFLYIYKDKDALRHLLSVACGLDSMILGETQILGQVKFAFNEAEDVGFVDEFLKDIFYSAIFFAKRMQRVTKISEGKVSIGSVAIDFVKEKIGNLSGKNILIIGVGKVTELVLRYLKKEEPNVVFISNRTFEKAKKMANQIGAQAVRFDNLREYLKRADILITATASPHVIIKKRALKEVFSSKLQAPSSKLLIIDLALPRDVDPGVADVKNVELFGLEDLNIIIRENKKRKDEEAEKVRRIIHREVDELWPEFTELERERALLL